MGQNQNIGNARPRIARMDEQILSILEEYDSNGFTAKEFAEVSDVNYATFYSWLKKYRSKSKEEEVKGFAKVEVTPAFTNARPLLFSRVGDIEVYKEMPAEYLKYLLA